MTLLELKLKVLDYKVFLINIFEYYSSSGAYALNPPRYAQDPFNKNESSKCRYCHSWMTVVRPGKTQCDTCCDGYDKKWINFIEKRMK